MSSQPLHELPGAALLRGGRPLAFAAAAKAAAGKALLGGLSESGRGVRVGIGGGEGTMGVEAILGIPYESTPSLVCS